MRKRWVLLGVWAYASALACAGGNEQAVSPTPVIGSVVCPEGSNFDPARSLCVAGAPPPVVIPDAGVAIVTPPPPVTADAGASVGPIAVADAGAAAPPPPLQAGAVNVSCTFPNGWVTVLPVGKYPKDDSFVMQALIGFTQDPRFWGSEPEYAPLKPYAAKRCGSSAVSFSVAPGDYWLLVGQEGTFSARGRYDKNGVKRKITVTAAGATYGVGPSDLVQTWLCISCPWFRTYREDGSVATSFVVLAHRSDPEHDGTDRISLVHAPVVAGRIVARVLEREDEVTYLDELVLVVREPSGREVTLFPRLGGTRSAVASADGIAVELARGTEIALEYELPPSLRDATTIDGVVVATGHYVLPPDVVDLHVDVGDAIHRRGLTFASRELDANADRLLRGHVTTLVAPLFVPEAQALPPADVLREYDAIERDLRRALVDSAWRGDVIVGFEGADGFADDPGALAGWAQRGACLMGLVHRRSNALGGASQEPALAERRRGLSERGRAVATKALDVGMILDVAHASDATFDDLAALAEARGRPFVDSHTGARALVDIERNLDDARMARVARSGGVVAIDVHGGHVASVPGEAPTLDDVAAHVARAIAIAGPDHVAIGSDLAGNVEAPSGADGAAIFPALARALARKGVSTAVIDAVFRGNAQRVLAKCPPPSGRAR